MSEELIRKCAKCDATSSPNEKISFHRFPKPGGKTNMLRAKAWATYCWPQTDWSKLEALNRLYLKHKMLCGRHFHDSCFTDSTKNELQNFSVPENTEYARNIMTTLKKEMRSEQNTDLTTTESEPGLDKASAPSTQTQAVGQNEVILKRVNNFSQLTMKEKKIFRIATNELKKLIKLRKKMDKLKIKRIDWVCDDYSYMKLRDLKLSPSFVLLLQNQRLNWPKRPKRKCFNLKQKTIALSMYLKSPALYRLLRRIFALPCQYSLNNVLNRVPLETGIYEYMFDSLKDVMAFTDYERLCILAFDIMAIRKNLRYNAKLDCVEGFEDHGDQGRTDQVACNALVFTASGVRSSWSHPVAFYFTAKKITGERLAVLIKSLLTKCFRIGLKVVATVCGFSQTNIEALEVLGATTEAPYFEHRRKEIVTILDPAHLLTCVRDLLMKYDIEYQAVEIVDVEIPDGQIKTCVAKWSHIQQFYEVDKENEENTDICNRSKFVFAPFLTDAHINPNRKQKKQVNLAADVFSHKVMIGFFAKIASKDLPEEASQTNTLIINLDQFCNILNARLSSYWRDQKAMPRSITARTPHMAFFDEIKALFLSMKFINCPKPPPAQAGWVRTINAVQRLWTTLNASGVQRLSTRRLKKYYLDKFLKSVRFNCGSNRPTVPQFIAGIKMVLLKQVKKDTYLFLKPDYGITRFIREHLQTEYEEEENEKDFHHAVSEIRGAYDHWTLEGQACLYVCGLILNNLDVNNCGICGTIFLDECAKESCFKKINMMVNLIRANEDLVQCVEFGISLMNNFLKTDIWQDRLKDKALSALAGMDFSFLAPCSQHKEENELEIKKIIFYICVQLFCD